jgi:hypothetical protein
MVITQRLGCCVTGNDLFDKGMSTISSALEQSAQAQINLKHLVAEHNSLTLLPKVKTLSHVHVLAHALHSPACGLA